MAKETLIAKKKPAPKQASKAKAASANRGKGSTTKPAAAKKTKKMSSATVASREIEQAIRLLARDYGAKLKLAIERRIEEMKDDDRSHFLIYQVLDISCQEGQLVDEYQNKGRFLYKYAGSFLEEAARLCFLEKYPEAKIDQVPNTTGRRPKMFEIDCRIGSDAIEIKWRDATTDGDHILKEEARIEAIVEAKYTPIRVMFYYPNRDQAVRIQRTLEKVYKG